MVELVLIPVFLLTGAGDALDRGLQDHGFAWDVRPSAAASVDSFLIAMFLDAGGLLEKSAWRGFALPLLQARHSPTVASVILGLLWSAWHLPVKFKLGLNDGLTGFVTMFALYPLHVVEQLPTTASPEWSPSHKFRLRYRERVRFLVLPVGEDADTGGIEVDVVKGRVEEWTRFDVGADGAVRTYDDNSTGHR